MWKSLGFYESPYNTQPLKPRPEDVDLLVGRETEAIELITNLDSSDNGIIVLSGSPGVGKTSFFNIQQYKLENELTLFGPKLLAARILCPVQASDDVRTLSIRALESLFKSVEQWCLINETALPPQTKELGKWISGAGNSGFSLGITIAGFGGNVGRNVSLPKLADISFEGVSDAICAITAEAVEVLGFESVVIALDNLENFSDDQLGIVLMSFRDTLFSIPHVWWILIGQSGLGSLIQSLDPRVFERITGSGIEINPVELNELDQAIAIRVTKFHGAKNNKGKAPLTTETHRLLYEASFGEMRFVFKYSNSICTKFVEKRRADLLQMPDIKKIMDTPTFKEHMLTALSKHIGVAMTNSQVPHKVAGTYLREIIEKELNGFFLKPKEKHVLLTIGQLGKARPKEFKLFSMTSMQDFSSNYLTKLYNQNLLVREQEGRNVNYRLRGIANLSYSLGLLN